MVCEMQGLDIEKVQAELEKATRTVLVPNLIDFAAWDLTLLIGYITAMHHQYLKVSLPPTGEMLAEFVEEHRKKYEYLDELELKFKMLNKLLLEAMIMEEEVLFPYIKQLDHAHRANESYASLLVRTLRKPVEESQHGVHKTAADLLRQIRQLTGYYAIPEKACTSHKVVLAKLRELDHDLAQHLYLEESVLFNRTTAMEKELLGK